MHVGFVVYGGLDGRSGGYRYDRQLVSYLRRQGDRVDIIDLSRRGYARHLADGSSTELRRRLDRPFDVLVQDELCHPSLWRHNPRLDRPGAVVALVHLIESADPTAAATPADRAVRRLVERRYLRSVDAAVATSRHTELLTADYGGVPTTVAHPAGRVEGAGTPAGVAARRARQGPLRVLFVGALVPRKGVLVLLDALAGLDAEWSARVVGDHRIAPGYARRVRARAASVDAGSVSVHGRVPTGRLRGLYRWADVLAVPAAYEGFGMVYLEAMEQGAVPIATANGGADDIVDATNGRLVDPSTTAVRDALARLAADRETLAGLARGAVDTASSHPDWDSSMRQVRAFLHEQARVPGREVRTGDRRQRQREHD